MSESDFVHIGDGLIVPWAVMLAILEIERAGHGLVLDGDEVFIERGRGMPEIEPEALEALRKWRAHVWLVVRHIRGDGAPAKRPDEAVA